MIDIEKLKNVKRLITHANCPDGIASALIVKDALPDVEVVFMSHGTEAHKNLKPEYGTLFVDFTPHMQAAPREEFSLAAWMTAEAIVLDHHPTQRDLTMKFVEAGLGIYGENDKNECGAWLAYEHVWLPIHGCGQDECNVEKKARAFAELAGVRDTWKKDDPRWQEACEQAAALIFWGSEYLGSDAFLWNGGGPVGIRLVEKQLEHARKSIGESHTFVTQRGTRVLMFQGVTPTSDAAEILDPSHYEGKDEIRAAAHAENLLAEFPYLDPPNIVAGFHYRVDAGKLKLQFSTRSHTGYDVGAFCKSKGGGGHTAAAGFTVEQSPEVGANPYAVFKLLLEEWEQGQ